MFKKSLVHCYAISRDVSGVTLSSLKLKLARSPERLATKVMAELAEPPLFRDAEYASSIQAELIPRNTTERRNATIGHFKICFHGRLIIKCSRARLATKVMAELAEPPMMTSVEECNAAIGHFRMSPKLKNKKDPKGAFL